MKLGRKMNMLVGFAAGAAMLVLAAGCQHAKPDTIVHGEEFVPEDGDRSLRDFNDMQAANAARADATLRSYHFDSTAINSLGQDRIDLMLKSGYASNPLVVYVDLPADDAQTADRQKAVTAYLKDRGLGDEQISLKTGPNPNWNSPTAPLIAAQQAAGGAPPAGGAAPPAGGPAMGH